VLLLVKNNERVKERYRKGLELGGYYIPYILTLSVSTHGQPLTYYNSKTLEWINEKNCYDLKSLGLDKRTTLVLEKYKRTQ